MKLIDLTLYPMKQIKLPSLEHWQLINQYIELYEKATGEQIRFKVSIVEYLATQTPEYIQQQIVKVKMVMHS